MSVTFNSYGTPIYDYFDEEWRSGVYTCPKCGWSGNHEEMSGPNVFKECMDYECPKCWKMLLIIGYPTYQETCEAAANGSEYAKAELSLRNEIREIHKRRCRNND